MFVTIGIVEKALKQKFDKDGHRRDSWSYEKHEKIWELDILKRMKISIKNTYHKNLIIDK